MLKTIDLPPILNKSNAEITACSCCSLGLSKELYPSAETTSLSSSPAKVSVLSSSCLFFPFRLTVVSKGLRFAAVVVMLRLRNASTTQVWPLGVNKVDASIILRPLDEFMRLMECREHERVTARAAVWSIRRA